MRRSKTLLVFAFYTLLLILLFSPSWTGAILSDQVASRDISFHAAFWVCTHSQGYWKTHPDSWPVEQLELGGETYSKQEALQILNTPSAGDATYILAYQLIAAKLNVASGADDTDIEDTITEADSWLLENPLGSDPKGEERETGIELAARLESYNEGEIGPGMCEEQEIPTATPSPQPAHTTIDAEKSAEASWKKKEGHGVDGVICVVNLGGAETENLTIFDQLQYRQEGEEIYQDLEGVTLVIHPEVPIPACDEPEQPESCPQACYEYQIFFEPPENAVAFRNTAQITITNHRDWLPGDANCPGPDPCPFGPQVSADFELSEKAESQAETDRASEPDENMTQEIIVTPLLISTATPTPSPSETASPVLTLTPIPSETATPN